MAQRTLGIPRWYSSNISNRNQVSVIRHGWSLPRSESGPLPHSALNAPRAGTSLVSVQSGSLCVTARPQSYRNNPKKGMAFTACGKTRDRSHCAKGHDFSRAARAHKTSRALAPAEKLASPAILKGFVTGHDFSRADRAHKTSRALAPAKKLASPANLKGFVTGHDFSRADRAHKTSRALAPAERFWVAKNENSPYFRSLSCPCRAL
jgi:hypothetical protein